MGTRLCTCLIADFFIFFFSIFAVSFNLMYSLIITLYYVSPLAVHFLFDCFIDFELITFAERLAMIRQQRAETAKKREEEKAGMVLYYKSNPFTPLFHVSLITSDMKNKLCCLALFPPLKVPCIFEHEYQNMTFQNL